MKSILTFLILFVSVVLPVYSQTDKPLQLSNDAEAEFDVALNPTNEENIIVATMRGFESIADSYLTIYYTKDFGETWEVSEFQGRYEGIGAGDPVLSFDSEGNAYLVNLVGNNAGEVVTVLSKSEDGGATWEKVADYGEFTDKPWLEIDRSASSTKRGHKYIPIVADQQRLVTYDENDAFVGDFAFTIGDQLPSVCVGENGDVYVTFIVLDDPNEIIFHHLMPGGQSVVTTRAIASFPDYTFNAQDISTRFQPTVYSAVDNSGGEFSGRIYVAYTGSEVAGLDIFNVYLTYSDDQGVSWSEPKPIHENVESGVQQFYSSIYVNEDGVLFMDWYDRGSYGPDQGLTDFVMGISVDGGENFNQITLTSEPMNFDFASQAGFGFGVGEYHQCIATKEEALSFWSDGRTNDGDLNIYFANVVFDENVSVEEIGLINKDISISSPFPNPISDRFSVAIDLKKKQNLRHQIIDLKGNIISASTWNEYAVGNHLYSIDNRFAPGVYTFKLMNDTGYFKTSKIVITQ